MAFSDQTFSDLYTAVLAELKEPSAGSNAMPLATVKNKVNEAYYDVFNEPYDQAYVREKSYEFTTIIDTTTAASVAVSAVSITATDSSDYGSTGTFLLNGTDIVTYSANASNVFTVTGVSQAHDSGAVIQYLYSLPSDIDEQEVTYLNINGIPYTYVPYTDYFTRGRTRSYQFTIFDSKLYLPQGQAEQRGILTYMQSITLMSDDTDKPTLIPNKWRTPLLVYGACTKLAARDDLRTGWDWYEQRYREAIIKFYAEANNRVRSKNRRNQGSVYD